MLDSQEKTINFFDGIYKLACWGLGALFICAGTSKLLEPRTFATLIEAYGIIPENLSVPVAVVLSAAEVLAGVGLILNIKGSLSVMVVLLLLFVAILAYGIWMGLDVDCGCFGSQDPEAEAFHGLWNTLNRDLGILAGIAVMFGWRRYRAIRPIQFSAIIKKRDII